MRHMEKVKEAIKNNLPDLITEESIIMSDGRDVVKIPIRSLDEYKIRYNYNKNKHVGQGDGDSQVGDVVAREPASGKEGRGKAKVSRQAISRELTITKQKSPSKKLKNPCLKTWSCRICRKRNRIRLLPRNNEFNDVRKKGLMGNIDKKRTILSALKRNAAKGKTVHHPDLQRRFAV